MNIFGKTFQILPIENIEIGDVVEISKVAFPKLKVAHSFIFFLDDVSTFIQLLKNMVKR